LRARDGTRLCPDPRAAQVIARRHFALSRKRVS
jgi:hypothetical protein